MSTPQDESPHLVSAEEFLAGRPDAFTEIHDGVPVKVMAQSPEHDVRVDRLLGAAIVVPEAAPRRVTTIARVRL
ncbi:hypothetical protein [Nocardia tengchongensis]